MDEASEAQLRCKECGWVGGAGDAYAAHTNLTGHLLVEVTEPGSR